MPKRSTVTTPKTPTTPVYAPDPESACEEAAGRLLVVIRLLGEHNDPITMTADDDHGYDLAIAQDALCAVRELLLNSAREEGRRRKAAEGGAR